jgi:predicted nucleotidyltransferase
LVGLDHVIDYVLQRVGNLEKVYLVGSLSQGKDSDIIDLVLVGDINEVFLKELIVKAEKKIHKSIHYINYKEADFNLTQITEPNISPLLLWSK